MTFLVYSCQGCGTYIYQDQDHDFLEIHTSCTYCQACADAIDKVVPPAEPLTEDEIEQARDDAWYNENSKAAYDSYRQSIDDANDLAATDPYHGRR